MDDVFFVMAKALQVCGTAFVRRATKCARRVLTQRACSTLSALAAGAVMNNLAAFITDVIGRRVSSYHARGAAPVRGDVEDALADALFGGSQATPSSGGSGVKSGSVSGGPASETSRAATTHSHALDVLGVSDAHVVSVNTATVAAEFGENFSGRVGATIADGASVMEVAAWHLDSQRKAVLQRFHLRMLAVAASTPLKSWLLP